MQSYNWEKLFNFKFKTNIETGIRKFVKWYLYEYKNKEKLKFGLLGLGTVVRIRVANLLKNELKKK